MLNCRYLLYSKAATPGPGPEAEAEAEAHGARDTLHDDSASDISYKI